jgi:hypothetical protein
MGVILAQRFSRKYKYFGIASDVINLNDIRDRFQELLQIVLGANVIRERRPRSMLAPMPTDFGNGVRRCCDRFFGVGAGCGTVWIQALLARSA